MRVATSFNMIESQKLSRRLATTNATVSAVSGKRCVSKIPCVLPVVLSLLRGPPIPLLPRANGGTLLVRIAVRHQLDLDL